MNGIIVTRRGDKDILEDYFLVLVNSRHVKIVLPLVPPREEEPLPEPLPEPLTLPEPNTGTFTCQVLGWDRHFVIFRNIP